MNTTTRRRTAAAGLLCVLLVGAAGSGAASATTGPASTGPAPVTADPDGSATITLTPEQVQRWCERAPERLDQIGRAHV